MEIFVISNYDKINAKNLNGIHTWLAKLNKIKINVEFTH